MSSPNRDRRINIPSKGKKDSHSSNNFQMSRPDVGRQERPNSQQRAPQRNNRNHGRSNRRNSGNKPKGLPADHPLQKAGYARVLDHDVEDNVIYALSENPFVLARLKPKEGISNQMAGERIWIGKDRSRREVVDTVLGMTSVERLSNAAGLDLPLIIQLFIEENAGHFINSFFNKAGPLSLKQHAFELLPGIGGKKAQQMVEIRGRVGFKTLEELNEKCAIDAAELLANRFHQEMSDRNIQPRLVELLLPVKA